MAIDTVPNASRRTPAPARYAPDGAKGVGMQIMTTEVGQVLRLTGDEMVKIRLDADRVLYVLMKGDETTLMVSPEADSGPPAGSAPTAPTPEPGPVMTTPISFGDLVTHATGPGQFTLIEPGYQTRLWSPLEPDSGVIVQSVDMTGLGE